MMTLTEAIDKYEYPVCIPCHEWLGKPRVHKQTWADGAPPGPAPERVKKLGRYHEECFICAKGTIAGLYLRDPPEELK